MKTGGHRLAAALIAVFLAGCVAPEQLAPAAAISEQTPVPPRTGPDIYDNVCHLKTSRSGLGSDGGDGSAVLYRGRYLITAAHNVFSPFYNRVTRIDVHCGARDVAGAPADFVLTDRSWGAASGYQFGRYSRDLGVIRLPQEIRTSHRVELADRLPGTGALVELVGYPGRGIDNADAHVPRHSACAGPRA